MTAKSVEGKMLKVYMYIEKTTTNAIQMSNCKELSCFNPVPVVKTLD